MKIFKIAMGAGFLLSVPLYAQFTYPGCSSLQQSDFQATELFNKTGANTPLATNSGLVEPVQFDVQGVYNTAGDSVLYTNVYFVERKGKVKFYDGLNKRVDSIGFIPNWGYQSSNNSNDNGLMGIVLDPNFNTNKWIYFWYCPTIPGAPATGATSNANRRLRLSRITVNSQNRLDMASEKILIDVLGSKTDQYHSGGPMTFDRNGDLWVTIGNNSNDLNGSGSQYAGRTSTSPTAADSSNSGEWGSGNTASIRGGVIRIHPDNNATTVRTDRSGTYGPGYTIPAGNFGEYWAGQFDLQNNSSLAAQYRDPTKVLPEVYVKGTRSNYSVAVHPTKGWLAWGDVQYNANNDEYNLVTHPAFTGMPYFMANNQPTPAGSIVLPTGHSAATPINNSLLNSGVQNLPPATSALIWYGTTTTQTTMNNNVAIGGPIYVYDRNLKSSVKFPPHLNNSWVLMTVYGTPSSGQMYIATLDSINPVLVGIPQQQATAGVVRFSIRNPLQAKYGPEGALYVLQYGSTGAYASGNNPGLVRINYTGSCQLSPIAISSGPSGRKLNISMSSEELVIREGGAHELGLYTVGGTRLAVLNGFGETRYPFSRLAAKYGMKQGVYVVRVKSSGGEYTRKVSLL
ncbi:MAG TPA: hypothetical protein DCQ83_04375 [Fibrobacteres bacterium]|jgi:cytochrome c|nr:hypothetical protein [Fibrobacterota bacterium]